MFFKNTKSRHSRTCKNDKKKRTIAKILVVTCFKTRNNAKLVMITFFETRNYKISSFCETFLRYYVF